MTMTNNTCDICGVGAAVGVAAVPGAPMSMAYCKPCLEHGAVPLFVVGFHAEDALPGANPAEHLADWFLEQRTYLHANDIWPPRTTICECGHPERAHDETLDGREVCTAAPCPCREWAAVWGPPHDWPRPVESGYVRVRDLFPEVPRWLRIVSAWHDEQMQRQLAKGREAIQRIGGS